MKRDQKRSPWAWIPSLYFAEGIPYVAVASISLVMYKKMGLSNADIAFYTSWLTFPWVIKPLWSPFVDLIRTKRWWIVSMELLIGAGLAGIAFLIPASFAVQGTLALFFLIAFSSATHDIAADGFYLLALTEERQAFFVGIRSTFYRLATIFGQGVLIFFAGYLEESSGNIPYAWSITFFILSGIFLTLFVYHRFRLPHPGQDAPNLQNSARKIMREFGDTFSSFFRKKHIASALFFMLTYRFSEAQLQKLIQPFMLDATEAGGLNLSTRDVGTIYGVIGIIGLMAGGIIGGILASRGGLKRWLWPMMLGMLLTSASFVYLGYVQPTDWFVINLCILIEQFGYGFGFTAYMLYLMYFSRGERQTAHYAICTGFMALGLMLPGMMAGWIQEQLGYQKFFLWVMACSIVPIIAASLIKTEETAK